MSLKTTKEELLEKLNITIECGKNISMEYYRVIEGCHLFIEMIQDAENIKEVDAYNSWFRQLYDKENVYKYELYKLANGSLGGTSFEEEEMHKITEFYKILIVEDISSIIESHIEHIRAEKEESEEISMLINKIEKTDDKDISTIEILTKIAFECNFI